MQLGRDVSTSTAVVGYAGGKENSKSTCYYYNAPDTLYEKQGHAEVVQVGIDSAKAAEQFGAFSETYFSQFQKTRFGMIRLVRLFRRLSESCSNRIAGMARWPMPSLNPHQ